MGEKLREQEWENATMGDNDEREEMSKGEELGEGEGIHED